MHRYAMIGYYPNEVRGQVFAVGKKGVTVEEARGLAEDEGLEIFQLFPLPGQGGGHRCYRLREGGGYEQGRSREFAARLSAYVGGLIEKDEADRRRATRGAEGE